MRTLVELGQAAATRRRAMGMKQGEVAKIAGIAQAVLSRFERGKLAEFGTRKLLAVLSAIEMEIQFMPVIPSGSLDDLRRERGGG